MFRVINKTKRTILTALGEREIIEGLFLRDDFTFNPETEIGLDVEPAQGFYHPKWDGEKWVEGLTKAEIEGIKADTPKELTPQERIAEMEAEIARLKSELNVN